MTRWRDLTPEVRAVAWHEAGHSLVGEALGWRVRFLRLDDGGGLCQFTDAAAVPWVDLVVSGAGHAAERWYCGKVLEGGSYSDREQAGKVVEQAGLEVWDSPFAVAEMERSLWPVFTNEDVDAAVKRVASELGRRGYLSRRDFLALADPALDHATRRTVRRFCRRLALDVHAKHFQPEGT